MATAVSLKPRQQEHCDLCNRCLRIKIITVSPTITYEVYGNPSSEFGGLFCSTTCSLNYTKKIRKKNKEQKIINIFNGS